MTVPSRNSEFCFPSRENKTHSFLWGQSLSAYYHPGKLFDARVALHVKFARQTKTADLLAQLVERRTTVREVSGSQTGPTLRDMQ